VPNTQDVTGGAPVTFTDSRGAQRSIPLEAFEFDGSAVKVTTAWQSQFTPADVQILTALTKAKVAAGELAPPPVLPPSPALAVTAATAGSEGNNVSVTVTPDGGDLVNVKLKLQAKETDTYPGLADASAAANAIGVDVAGGSDGPPVGGGLVAVVAGSASGTGLPKDGQTLTVKSATNVVGTDGSAVLFKLVPRPGYGATGGAGIPVTVSVDPGGKTFTVKATYSGVASGVTLAGLAKLPPDVAFLVDVSAPSSGFDLPGASTVTLSGGAPGVPATGTLYTS
jgi:hypothetical protein